MKLSLSLFATALIALSALPAHAQSVAKSGQQCDPTAEEITPELDCINPDAGTDVRLYVMEYQSCDSKGNINKSDFDRDASALVTRNGGNVAGDVDYVDGDAVKLTLDKVRTHMDFITGANFSMVMPTSAVIKDGGNTFTLKITKTLQPDYDGALPEEVNFKGSFVETDSSGKQISSGRLSCGIDM